MTSFTTLEFANALAADAERRRHPPPGADGGEDGALGRNLVGDREVEPKASGTLRAGERLRIETPGGGGHGQA